MLNAVTAIWKFRYFLFALVRLDLRQRYKRSFLGLGWAIIHPAATAAAYVVVFGGVLAQSTPSYIVTLLIGLAVWGFIRESAVSGCLAIVSHESFGQMLGDEVELGPWHLACGASFDKRLAPQLNIDAYTRLDLGLAWRVGSHLRFELWGQNLLDARHAESSGALVPRGVQARMTYALGR